MAIDIKNLIEFVQRDIANIDSTGDTQRILDLARFVDRQAKTTLLMYDSTSDLPNLLDDTADTAQLVFVANQRRLFVNQGAWKPMARFAAPVPIFLQPYTFQGSNFGYTSGGWLPGGSNVIDKFPFASDANASDVGDLFEARAASAGQSSIVSGYSSGGTQPPYVNTIDKFPFAVDANATDVGDLLVARFNVAGQSSSENGYSSGGNVSGTSINNDIDKFPFAVDANATDVGDLTLARTAIGQSSSENGYSSGGTAGPLGLNTNTIDKFPFAVDANATDVGDLLVARRAPGGGQSSSENGYTAGGLSTPTYPATNVIDKFPFASDENATDVGDLTVARTRPSGQSSTVSGYSSGGLTSSTGYSNVIDKFPFASDANATDVGDLTQARENSAGQQY